MNRMTYGIGIASLLLTLSACAPSTQSLKPIATQNQQNLAALTTNVNTVLALYEPLLQASGNTLIYQRIGKIEQEMIAVVGIAVSPSAEQTWQSLFEQAATKPLPKREKYLERYRFVQVSLERGNMEDADLNKLKTQEGWIYQVVADTNFTPQKAYTVLKSLGDLRKETVGKSSEFYQRAESALMPYDPSLQLYRQAINDAQTLLVGLKQELNSQLTTANVHSQAILGYSDSNLDMQKTFDALKGGLDQGQLETVLNNLSQKYLNNPLTRKGAIDLLTNTLTHVLGK